MRRILNELFEDLSNIDTQEQIAFQLCTFDGIRGGNYLRGESIRRTEVESRVRKIKNGKGADEITGEMVKGAGDRAVDWICRLCNRAFESGLVQQDWRLL